MCDVHVSIVVLVAGLALSLHCDLLASNLIIREVPPDVIFGLYELTLRL